MKRIIYILIVISFIVLNIAIFINPLIIFLAKRQIENVFIDSEVYIGKCSLKPANELKLSDIEIKKRNIYDFKIKEISFYYNLASIFKRSILKSELKDTLIAVNLGQKSILEMKSLLKLSPNRIFLLDNLEISNLELNLKSKDLNAEANISAELNLIDQLLNYIHLQVGYLNSGEFHLENAYLKAKQNSNGEIKIARVKYNKARIEDIDGKVLLQGRILFLDSLAARILGGKIKGDFNFWLDKNQDYTVNLEFLQIDLDTFVKDFELKDKFQITGKLDGKLALKGSDLNIKDINGDFSTAESGGVLTIKDNKFLENLANTSKQSLDILLESFKDYHYNKGIMKLSLKRGNLILDVALDGDAGKRNLNIVVHDFRLKKEGL